ncbi:hypothetical protein ACIBG0_28865 [Nocardia sp. NPDC050630]|uniref:hypothetical protein n=1 Tax=Nocardia sp. NPDC050630 TaxID=3364321 RepID=UPI0037A29965
MTRAAWRKFRPVSDGHWATIALDSRGELLLINRRPTASEIFYSPPTGVYWVDVSVHHASVKLELPTAEGVFNFLADADLSWRIANPVQAVRDKVISGEDIYRPFVEHELRVMSREFEVDRFIDAEKHINTNFAVRPVDLPCGVALLDCRAKLRPEADTLSHIKHRTFDERAEERRLAEHEAQLRNARLMRDENETEHDLALQSSKFEHSIAELELRSQLNLERRRMAHYADALQAGDLGMLALRLASSRDDVNDVIQLLMNQKQMDLETAQGIVNALLDQRLYNKRDAEPLMAGANAILENHMKRTSQRVPSAEPAGELTKSSILEEAEAVDDPDDDGDDYV